MATLFRRRRVEPLAPPARSLSGVFVRPELLRAVAAAAAVAGDNETGGPLVGTVHRSWNGRGFCLFASVLGTVPPGPATDGSLASLSLGFGSDGERAASALRWLRSVTGLDLVHLGDWHTHPSGFVEPSAGDRKTAGRIAAELGRRFWLVAIGVSEQSVSEDVAAQRCVASLSRDSSASVELRFYDALGGLARVPVRVDADALPRLPPLPWHVADPTRFAAECRLLDAAGFKIRIGSDDGDAGLTLRLERDGRSVAVATGAGYPAVAPKLLDGRRRFFAWSPDRFLVDLVREAV